MKKFISVVIFAISFPAFSADWINDKNIYDVGVKYGNGCVTLEGGEIVKIDLTTDAGKAEYSLVLAALASGKTIDIYQNDNNLVGGCNTGTTIRQHSIITINK